MPFRIISTNRFIVRDASSLSIPGQNVKDIRIDPRSRAEYIAKRPTRTGRAEAITECLLNCIGERLGVQMAGHTLGICDGELRFMSENFLGADEALVHGIEFLSQFHKQGFANKLKSALLRKERFTRLELCLKASRNSMGRTRRNSLDCSQRCFFWTQLSDARTATPKIGESFVQSKKLVGIGLRPYLIRQGHYFGIFQTQKP